MKTKNIFIINANLIQNNFPKENTIYYNMIVNLDIQTDPKKEPIYTKLHCDKVVFYVKDNKTYIDEVVDE